MPLFPEIDVTRLAESHGQNGSAPLPAEAPAGVVAGLNASLLHLLANFKPTDLGVCALADNLQITLPLSNWDWYSFWQRVDTASITAGSGTWTDFLTVPNDERWWLDSIRLERVSGDNTADGVDLVYPEGYYSVDARNRFLVLSTAGPDLFWPDPGGQQTWDQYSNSPILLEPGTVLQVDPSGAGVAATIFRARIATRRTKLIRAMAP